MSAPKRIWLDWPDANRGDVVYDEPPERDTQPGQTEYIRADLHDAAIAAARAEGVREGMLKAADRLDLAEHDAEERDWRSGANAFAALAKAIRAAAEAQP